MHRFAQTVFFLKHVSLGPPAGKAEIVEHWLLFKLLDLFVGLDSEDVAAASGLTET
jgi:hypothetical protein